MSGVGPQHHPPMRLSTLTPAHTELCLRVAELPCLIWKCRLEDRRMPAKQIINPHPQRTTSSLSHHFEDHTAQSGSDLRCGLLRRVKHRQMRTVERRTLLVTKTPKTGEQRGRSLTIRGHSAKLAVGAGVFREAEITRSRPSGPSRRKCSHWLHESGGREDSSGSGPHVARRRSPTARPSRTPTNARASWEGTAKSEALIGIGNCETCQRRRHRPKHQSPVTTSDAIFSRARELTLTVSSPIEPEGGLRKALEVLL